MTGSFTMTVSDLMNGDYDADVKIIGLDGYPIFDEQHRKILNDKIVMRYWTREIGVETDSLFRHHMRRTMNEIMPQFNQLYESTRIEFDPMSTIDVQSLVDSESLNDLTTKSNSTGSSNLSTSGTNSAKSSSENSNTTSAKSRAVASEMPQTQLAGHHDYATSATDSISDSTGSGRASGTETGERSESQKGTTTAADSGTQSAVGSGKVVSSTTGRQAPGAALIQAYRDQIINVDVMVLDALEPLFMQLWTNHDSYSERGSLGISFYQYPIF